MKVLLLSAYDASSHAYWREGLVAQFPKFDWTVLTLPARHFAWRSRGNSLTWAYGERAVLEAGYDLLITTSMTDLSALRGLVPALTKIPTLVYFHENQFAYPVSGNEYGGAANVEPKILNLYTALAGDYVVFNSEFNRTTFLRGVSQLLKKLPDHVPENVVDLLTTKSAVLSVPLTNTMFSEPSSVDGPLQIVWNHRWEFDKGPELLYDALKQLSKTSADFIMHVVGQRFRKCPAIFDDIKREFSSYIGCWGFVESADAYRKLLRQSDVVLSTALHDYQGIAVLEGVASGCVPVVPDRLAYPELFDEQYRYAAGKSRTEANALAQRLAELSRIKREDATQMPVAPDINDLKWSAQRGRYLDIFNKVL